MNNIYNFPQHHNKNRTVGSTKGLFFEHIIRETGDRLGIHDIPCPFCGPIQSTSKKRNATKLRVWHEKPGFAGYYCARCGEKGYARDDDASPPAPAILKQFKAETEERERTDREERLEKARKLWSQRLPVEGSIAERYLREARQYGGAIPATLGFLPARVEHAPAMIAAFGLAHEVEPGVVEIADASVRGVHLTRLLPDGSDRDRGPKAKIMIGRSAGWPIVLAPPNDLLALGITEGIEDALSAYEELGLGAWAAGSASRLPRLAEIVPEYIETAWIFGHDDYEGQKNADELERRLCARSIDASVITLGSQQKAVA
jgi:hypothetical protein